MKKLFLLAFILCLTSCSAQQTFENSTYQEPIFITVTGVMARNDDGTASVVKNNEYQRVFLFDSKDDMVEGWQYVVRLHIEHPEFLKGRKVVPATLVGYGISPRQARENAAQIGQMGNIR